MHRRSFIFCLYISPRSLSFTLVTSFISTVLLLCIPPVGQTILFYLLGNIKYRVCLLASGQPIFRGSSQRENEERFTTSVSILSYRILLTESGRQVDVLSGTLTFPYSLVGLHGTNYLLLFSAVHVNRPRRDKTGRGAPGPPPPPPRRTS